MKSNKEKVTKFTLNFLAIIIFVFLTLYLLLGLMMYINQDRFLYLQGWGGTNFYSCETFNDQYTREEFNTTRFFYRERSDTEQLLIYYHGSSGSACDRAHLAWRFERLRTSLIFVEYSGFGGDTRDPSKELLTQDVRNIAEFYSNKNYSDIIVVGDSLGTGLASYHAYYDNDVDKVILLAPFHNTRDLLIEKYRFYPFAFYDIDQYDNSYWLQNFTGKLTIIHGSEDTNVPISQSQKLFHEITNADKRFILIEGSPHNELYRYFQTWRAIRETVDPNYDLPLFYFPDNQ